MELRGKCSSKILLQFWLILHFCLFSLGLDETKSSNGINDFASTLAGTVFVVLSQPTSFHGKRAAAFVDHLTTQADGEHVEVLQLHKDWSHLAGGWTILPLLPTIYDGYKDTVKWVLICEEATQINLPSLMEHLNTLDPDKPHFLGKALRDKEITIIHHFRFQDNPSTFLYPDFAAGFVLSSSLLETLQQRIRSTVNNENFSIDPKHELAYYMWDEGKGAAMTDDPHFCTSNPSEDCVTSYTESMPQCGAPLPKSDIYVAVKTCEKFHKDRVQIVKKTWGKHVEHIEYMSESQDDSIPTVITGIANTESGHCGKLEFILRRAADHPDYIDMPWVLVADDDSILSINRLRQLLACYDPSEPVVLGERYGYGIARGYGYNYITGGGGMVLSRGAVRKLMFDGFRPFQCPEISSPDDMMLGSFCRGLNIPLVHSPLFHQARPADYSEGYLSWQSPVSFHKHWMNDPVDVYNQWFKQADDEDIDAQYKTDAKTEL